MAWYKTFYDEHYLKEYAGGLRMSEPRERWTSLTVR